MPAWITSELRELVCVPIASSAWRMITSRPASASSRAMARPTTPAPTTTASTLSMCEHPLEAEGGKPGERRGARHRARGAVEQHAEQRAESGPSGKADRADQRRSGARRLRERRERERCGTWQDERGAEKQHGERHHQREPVLGAAPGERRDGQPAAALAWGGAQHWLALVGRSE